MNSIFSMIVSGGVPGADQGALDAALELGHPYGGWCPHRRRGICPEARDAEPVIIPERYQLQEHSSSCYREVTAANVLDADGTLVFTFGEPSGGTALTIQVALAHGKPLYVWDVTLTEENPSPAVLHHWGSDHGIRILNVAGSRKSKFPHIQDLVKEVIREMLKYARSISVSELIFHENKFKV